MLLGLTGKCPLAANVTKSLRPAIKEKLALTVIVRILCLECLVNVITFPDTTIGLESS